MRSTYFTWLVTGTLLIVSSTFSCKGDYECKDMDYGRQYLMDASKASFAYKGGEKLFFKNSTNDELSFHIVPFGTLYPIWLSFTQDVKEGACVGETKIRSDLQALIVNIRSDTLDYRIIYEQRVHSVIQGTAPIYYDIMSSSMAETSPTSANWGISIKHLLDPRGNEDYLANNPISQSFTELITLNGKTFEQVYFDSKPDGSALYFNHSMGFVGFKERNKSLWVLDRIE